jgi:hypothetical protein
MISAGRFLLDKATSLFVNSDFRLTSDVLPQRRSRAVVIFTESSAKRTGATHPCLNMP